MRIPALALGLVLLTATASSAERLSTRDIIELSRAGLGDEVLVALIDVSRGVYEIDPAALRQLKEAGVSDRVIVALVRSGREIEPPPPPLQPEPVAEPPAPQVIVVQQPAPEPREVLVPVTVPVYVTGPVSAMRGRHIRPSATQQQPAFIPFQAAPIPVQPVVEEPKEPVYWGWGGKRRPDTWDAPARRPSQGKGDGRK